MDANKRTLNEPRSSVQSVRWIDISSAQFASSESAREINRDFVLQFIRIRQPIARADLSRISGLRPSTISAIVEQLIKEGWVTEGEIIKPSRGRPSTMLTINANKVSVALDVRPDRVNLAIVDFAGEFLSYETVRMYESAARTVAQVVARIRQLRRQYNDKSFEGIGVSMPGRVHPVTQRLLMAPNLNWLDFDLRHALKKGTGLQVELDNDANNCLLSELWYGRVNGLRNIVLVAVSEGLGASILAGGEIYSGYNGLAGEFGHISVDPRGPLCGCGQRGCWEMMASSRAALKVFQQLSPGTVVHNIHQLFSLADTGNRAAIAALVRQARALGQGLRLITAALSPELILITGDLTASWGRFGPIVNKALEDSMLAGSAPRLQISADGDRARLSGAAAMLMQRHVEYYKSNHGLPKKRRARQGK